MNWMSVTASGRSARPLSGGEVDVVVQTVIDRMSRNFRHQEALIYTAEKYGVRLEFVDEEFDDTPEGQLLRATKGIFAQMEREKIKQRTLMGRRIRAKSGKLLPANMPTYGLRWADVHKTAYVLHPTTSATLLRIYQSVAAGISTSTLARVLTQEGIPTPKDQWRLDQGLASNGDPWRRQTILHILKNPVYTGQHSAFRWDYSTKRREVDPFTGRGRTITTKRERPIAERIALPAAAPAFISPELAGAAKRRLEQNKAEALRNQRRPTVALLRAGYITCGQCGAKMRVHGGPVEKGHPFYYCPSLIEPTLDRDKRCALPRLRVDKLDDEVWERIAHELSNPDFVAREIAKRQRGDSLSRDKVEAFDKRLGEIDRQLKNLVEFVGRLDDPLERAPFLQQSRELIALRNELAEGKTEAERERAQVEQVRRQWARYEEWASAFARLAANDKITYDLKRTALYMLQAHVTVHSRGSEPAYTLTWGASSNEGAPARAARTTDCDTLDL
jgi:site-specific DNA recombinase